MEIMVDRQVVVTREDTHESVEGRFVSTWRHPDGRRFVGVAFSTLVPDFWHIAIPGD
jgi:hypothetical protein